MTVVPVTDLASAAERLAELLPGRILFDPGTREQFRTDFGRWKHRTPAAVARCRSAEEVATVIRFCREHGVPIAPRSQGHTQSGQSLTEGVLIDTSAMNRILEVNEDEGWADCEAGVIWRDLVIVATQKGMIPPVLTNNLSVSISGTTSVAGLGVASFRHGCQADQAIEMEVVTGDGEIHVCSADREPELFDMVRCSLGQIGFITRIKTRLRRCKPMVRQYTLVYDDLGRFMEDARRIMDPSDSTFSTLGGICSPAPLGFKQIGEGLDLGVGVQGFAHWIFPMFLTIEFESGAEPNDEEALSRISPYRVAHVEDMPVVQYCRRMEPMFQMWKMSGYWEKPHPWMEVILPWDSAREYIETVLQNLPPGALGAGGHVLLWPARTATSKVPLLVHPPGDFVLGWGVLGAVPPERLEEGLAKLDMASELSIAYGGKRYLSGFITFDTAEKWAHHFGGSWERFRAAKKRWDPDGILAPGFIQYE
ncbi:MAG TPA: FAD-binding oxidoreductase [Thermoanaerobaculia bacterium]|nr:FAD-binding oxidoreductase [Thermoanaerobaculia bacterium]